MAASIIHRRLCLMATDKWIDDATYYYKACAAKKVKPRDARQQVKKKQRTIDGFLTKTVSTPTERRYYKAIRELKLMRSRLDGMRDLADGDIEFVDVFKKKRNRNEINLPFKGIGYILEVLSML
jgi:hypothetical protein